MALGFPDLYEIRNFVIMFSSRLLQNPATRPSPKPGESTSKPNLININFIFFSAPRFLLDSLIEDFYTFYPPQMAYFHLPRLQQPHFLYCTKHEAFCIIDHEMFNFVFKLLVSVNYI